MGPGGGGASESRGASTAGGFPTLGSRWEPLVDGALLAECRDAALRLHSPQPREVVLQFDAPWEGPRSAYVTMLTHDGEHRMYYRGSRDASDGESQVAAVAVSRDGVAWERPELGLHDWDGSRRNNIVWTGHRANNFTPFVDTNPATDPSERFKAVASAPGTAPADWKRGLMAYASDDGFRWRPMSEKPMIIDGRFDSQNLAFWDESRECYVAYYRAFFDTPDGRSVRAIKRATSPDFRSWSPGEWLDYGGAPAEHLYTNAVTPYWRYSDAARLYLAFPRRFVPERRVIADNPMSGVSDGVFMSSRDGLRWDRHFMEAFLRPGPDRGNWTDRSNTIAWGMIPTAPGELSLYWTEHQRLPSIRQRRGVVRKDGFVSLHAGYGGGEAITHPLRIDGGALLLNFATSAAGSVRVELQDAAGVPIPGYGLDECVPMYGDDAAAVVRWSLGDNVGGLAGNLVRIRIVLHDADVYALRAAGADDSRST